jgi:hypothetical protein
MLTCLQPMGNSRIASPPAIERPRVEPQYSQEILDQDFVIVINLKDRQIAEQLSQIPRDQAQADPNKALIEGVSKSSSVGVSEETNHLVEMVSDFTSLVSLSQLVFKDSRELTEDERDDLKKFYKKAYKKL